MADDCLLELLLQKPVNGCKRPAGIGNEFYIGHTRNIASYTRNSTTKVLETLVMKQGKRLWKYAGRVRQNTAGSELVVTDNGVTFNQSVTMITDYLSQLDMDALENLCQVEDLFIVYLSNKGQWKVAGLNKDPDKLDVFPGIARTAGSFPEGTVAGDSNAATITFGGQLENNPVVFLVSTGTLVATKAYLEAALTPAA
jgi:hypothetical protein